MDVAALKSRLKTLVRLEFADGEIVEALLYHVDAVDHQDLTYEVKRIVQLGEPPALGTELGNTVVAHLADLVGWKAV